MVCVEFIIELFQVIQHLLHMTSWIDQVGDSEVVSALLLPETGPWHGHNSRLVYHLETVNEVGSLAKLLSLIDELLTEVDLREPVHGPFNLRARHLLHIIECIFQQQGSFF